MLTFLFLFLFLFLLIQYSAADCPENSIEWHSHCYSFFNISTGFADAELKCNQNGSHLVSIHDGFTNALLSQEAAKNFCKSTETDFWIGATTLIALKTWNWTDGTTFDFTEWNKGEPKNISGSNCAALSTVDGYWTSQDCFKSKPFVCETANFLTTPLPRTTPSYPLNGNCSMGWFYIPQAHACYGANGGEHAFTWTAAQNYCESIGAQLPAIHSSAEVQYLDSLISAFWRNLWTGIVSVDGGKVWKNADGTPADFLKYGSWCEGHPFKNVTGERCVARFRPCYIDFDCITTIFDATCKKSL
uniref:C-type lectin domain-containing protein n=1 Tax=Panagrolaimus superbus TaxID=310955 RepID=A0A914YBZ2_9BILA